MKNGGDVSAADHSRPSPDWQQQLLAAVLLTIEILQLLGHWTYITVEAIIRLVVPAGERSVAGEIVLITGTGHGIGRETALQYGRLGAIVVCVDINEPTNAQTVQTIANEGGKAFGFVCDVSDRAAVFALIGRVKETVGGGVSILVNNAGIMPCRPLLQQNESEIRRQFDINVMAHFWLVQATVPDMVAAKRGHVVALCSVAGMAGMPNLVPYCGTKFAVKGIMEALSEELRQTTPIKFTTIYPYMVDTGLCEKPFIRFPALMPLLKPTDVARSLISAQRRDVVGCSLPLWFQYTEGALRMFPVRCGQLMADFVATGVNAVN